MQRLLTATLILIAAMLQPLYAQDLDFTAVNVINAPGLGNQSLIGPVTRTGFLNAAVFEGRGLQPNLLSSFNVRDVAIADITADGIQDVAALTSDGKLSIFNPQSVIAGRLNTTNAAET